MTNMGAVLHNMFLMYLHKFFSQGESLRGSANEVALVAEALEKNSRGEARF